VKRARDLMTELGFREDAPESVKKAFIENLRKTLPLADKKKERLEQASTQLSLFEIDEDSKVKKQVG